MPIEYFKRIANRLDSASDFVVITGGEPLLHKNMHDMLLFLSQKKIRFSIASNGNTLLENIEMLSATPPAAISLSLDGNQVTHDSRRKKPGLYNKIYRALELLSSSLPQTRVSIQMTIAENNADCIEAEIQNLLLFNNIAEIKLTPDCNLEAFSHMSSLHSLSKKYKKVKTEIIKPDEMSTVLKWIGDGVYSPSLLVIKPDGWIHPFCGLGNEWNIFNATDSNGIQKALCYYRGIIDRNVLQGSHKQTYIDLNSTAYNYYKNIWFNQEVVLSPNYIIRCDEKLYIFDVINRTVISSTNKVLAWLLNECRLCSHKRHELISIISKKFNLPKDTSFEYIALVEKLKYISVVAN